MVTVVGIGPGDEKYITPIALEKIKSADVLVGGNRNLELFSDMTCEKIIINANTDYQEIFKKKGHIVFIASGDPLLYGITDVILRYKEKSDIEIVPGISSIQYIFSKIKISMNDMVVVSLHGREQELISKVKEYKKVAVLTDKRHTPQYIAKLLMENGIYEKTIYIGENLSYENEKISKYKVSELYKCKDEFDMNVVVITCQDV
ncbi:MAG: precorrin-6y C5,15-methyltransferase (decarboxylating) subunit CbiE [Thermoanaerobacteraceae bacterium]|nr:precorrin-6y C5,15-methyltransferase (decarboxylating) subunit CbiE [Thermoanaerobacteraceae bacterium]